MVLAFTLTLIAGLATIIGGIIGIHKSMNRPGRLSVMLAFAAGAMLCVSFLDLIPAAIDSLGHSSNTTLGLTITLLSITGGALIVYVIDRLIPCSNSVKCAIKKEKGCIRRDEREGSGQKMKLLRSGIVITAIMAIHNFPEGIVTFTGAMHDMSLGLSLAFAIALHNIPEGISIASPVYAATGNKLRAIKYTIISALAEPLGALFGYVLLIRTLPESTYGAIFAATAGMMIYISLSELLPSACFHSTHKRQPFWGTGAGVSVIAVSLILMDVM
jgi:ZIP family zinc transporter